MNLNLQRNINNGVDIFNIQVLIRNVLPMNLLKIAIYEYWPDEIHSTTKEFYILKMEYVFYCQASNKISAFVIVVRGCKVAKSYICTPILITLLQKSPIDEACFTHPSSN